jgi:hypothetical protein
MLSHGSADATAGPSPASADQTAGAPRVSAPRGVGVYYRARDAQGREYIVDSRDQLPAALRERAQRIEVLPVATLQEPRAPSVAKRIDWPSFAVGFGLGVLLVGVAVGVRRGFGPVAKLALLAALAVVLAGAYFGWLRRMSGQGDSTLSTPSALIDDAKRAVDQMNERSRKQEQILQELGQSAR